MIVSFALIYLQWMKREFLSPPLFCGLHCLKTHIVPDLVYYSFIQNKQLALGDLLSLAGLGSGV